MVIGYHITCVSLRLNKKPRTSAANWPLGDFDVSCRRLQFLESARRLVVRRARHYALRRLIARRQKPGCQGYAPDK